MRWDETAKGRDSLRNGAKMLHRWRGELESGQIRGCEPSLCQTRGCIESIERRPHWEGDCNGRQGDGVELIFG